MSDKEKLDALCEKFGPVAVAKMVGVTYACLRNWVKGRKMNGSASVALGFIYEKHLNQH